MMATLVVALAVMVNQEIRADQADLAMTAHVVLEANQAIQAFLVFQVLLQALAKTQFKFHASHRHHKFHHH